MVRKLDMSVFIGYIRVLSEVNGDEMEYMGTFSVLYMKYTLT